MSLLFTPCAYHNDRAAITVCERCRRPICLEDKRIYRRRHSRYVGEVNTYYYTSHDYCILCNAAQIETDVSKMPIGAMIFIVIAIFIFISFFLNITALGSFGSIGFAFPFFFMLIAFFGLVGIIFLFNFRNKQDEAKIANNEALEFKLQLNRKNEQNFSLIKQNNLVDTNTSTTNNISQFRSDGLYCFECGTKLEITDNFCPNCGDSTQDELKAYYKVH